MTAEVPFLFVFLPTAPYSHSRRHSPLPLPPSLPRASPLRSIRYAFPGLGPSNTGTGNAILSREQNHHHHTCAFVGGNERRSSLIYRSPMTVKCSFNFRCSRALLGTETELSRANRACKSRHADNRSKRHEPTLPCAA